MTALSRTVVAGTVVADRIGDGPRRQGRSLYEVEPFRRENGLSAPGGGSPPATGNPWSSKILRDAGEDSVLLKSVINFGSH